MSTPSTALLDSPSAPGGLRAGLITALAYAGLGGVAAALAGLPGHAAAPYTMAGLALAAALVWGRATLPGVWLGAALLQGTLGWLRGGPEAILLPALVSGAGAALQAGVGAWRRWRRTDRIQS